MSVPIKPFPTYKWRWLSVQPSEGLLQAPVYLGVLRALHKYEGTPFSSVDLHNELVRVKNDTKTDIDLARTPERNLFRNSGQYWRGTGVLANTRGEIHLTDLGRNISTGKITNDEFTALIIRNTILPNPLTYNEAEMRNWHDSNLQIKPLEIILAIMSHCGNIYGIQQSFLTPDELINIVIPLCGNKQTIPDICENLYNFRKGQLDISRWPNCAPAANDKRLAREFLLFLKNFGVCQVDDNTNSSEQKYILENFFSERIESDPERSFLNNVSILDEEISLSRSSEIPVMIERKRTIINSIARDGQPKFRSEVLSASNNQCIITNETILDVLEAAHIVPVGNGGIDHVNNGLCMRVDIHKLFDAGKIRIKSDGVVEYNNSLSTSISYRNLPCQINFHDSINISNIEWRWRYY